MTLIVVLLDVLPPFVFELAKTDGLRAGCPIRFFHHALLIIQGLLVSTEVNSTSAFYDLGRTRKDRLRPWWWSCGQRSEFRSKDPSSILAGH